MSEFDRREVPLHGPELLDPIPSASITGITRMTKPHALQLLGYHSSFIHSSLILRLARARAVFFVVHLHKKKKYKYYIRY
jgi:hypothetical protein